MPSIGSVVLREQIRLLRPILGKFDLKRERAIQDALGDIEAKLVAGRVDFENVEMGKFEAAFAFPKGEPYSNNVILYLHGGAYVTGNLKYSRGFASILADRMQRHVLAVAYRLAPENPFPAAVDDALFAYKYLLMTGYEPKNIIFAGESAGGGLILCLCHKLKELGLPLPAGLIALSPWTDLTFSGASYKDNEKKDPMLIEKTLRSHANSYTKTEIKNPLVSPLFGDLSGFPPSFIIAGGDELILSDSEMIHEKLLNSGSVSLLHVEEGMWHVYPLFGTSEARDALEMIHSFIEKLEESHDEN